MSKPVFAKPAGPTFFGIGAQRSGSTWLYKTLSSYPDCGLPPHKELHFFDVRHRVEPPPISYTERLSRVIEYCTGLKAIVEASPQKKLHIFRDDMLGPRGALYSDKLANMSELLRFYDLNSYIRFLDRYRPGGTGLVGDITPTYALLTRAGFQEMATRLRPARFIFIMRDPVNRFWSHARFLQTRGKFTGADLNDHMDELLVRPSMRERTDYIGTITTLESAVPPQWIHYAFFEALTGPDTALEEMRRLEQFLRLRPKSDEAVLANAGQPVNGAPEGLLTPHNRRRIMALMAPVYEFVRERFGALPAGWNDPRDPDFEQAA